MSAEGSGLKTRSLPFPADCKSITGGKVCLSATYGTCKHLISRSSVLDEITADKSRCKIPTLRFSSGPAGSWCCHKRSLVFSPYLSMLRWCPEISPTQDLLPSHAFVRFSFQGKSRANEVSSLLSVGRMTFMGFSCGPYVSFVVHQSGTACLPNPIIVRRQGVAGLQVSLML